MTAARTERILDRAHNAVITIDEAGLVTYWNPAAESIFGFSRDEMLGRRMAELILPERFRHAHQEGLRRFLSEGTGAIIDRRVEMSALRRDGVEFPVELTVAGLRDSGGWTFTAFVQDISERRRHEHARERRLEELNRALTGSEQRFDAIVGSLAEPVTIHDREHRIIYGNRAALDQLGFATMEELRATPPEQMWAEYIVEGADGHELSLDEIPSVRLLRGEPAEPLLLHSIHRKTGAERWDVLKASPLRDPAGRVEATITMIEDVTEQQRAEQRSRFLVEASEVLASSLDYEETLRNVAELAVPDIADWCAVDLIDAAGERVPVAIAHVDPARLKLAEELRALAPQRMDPDQGMGRVVRTGRSALYTSIGDDTLRAGASGARHLELLRSLGLRSAAVVPMRIGSRSLGALTLVTAESGRVLGPSDVEFAELVAARAAVAIENARVYSERSGIAHTLQQSLLPERLPEIPGYELASFYMPAFESAEVGGDFYDVWETDGGCMITIGDVTGKGVGAAALTALVRHTLRATAEFVLSPAELLARLDRILKKQHRRPSMCTALCLHLEGDRATLAAGGHPLPVRVTTEGAREVGRSGPLLGAFDPVEWEDVVLDFTPGTTLLVYTDGVTDAVGVAGERYGATRLHDTLDRFGARSAPQVIDGLRGALGVFQVGGHADDTAALAVRRLPA